MKARILGTGDLLTLRQCGARFGGGNAGGRGLY